jgi:hypothetical protein
MNEKFPPECEVFLRELTESGSTESAHARDCERCSSYVRLVHSLESSADRIEVPDLAGIHRTIRLTSRHTHSRRRRWLLATAFALEACAMLAIGFELAPHRKLPEPAEPASMILARLRQTSTSVSTPYLLADVRILDQSGDHVDVSAIAGQEVRLRLRRDDPLVAGRIVESWLRDGSTQERLEAASIAEPRSNPAVRAALIEAMQSDPSDAVQLLAQERLLTLPVDEALTAAFLNVIAAKHDIAVKVRAVDYLTKARVAPERLRAALTSSDEASRHPAAVRANNYLRD